MAEINLTQEEADRLMAMDKRYTGDAKLIFPGPGDRVSIPLVSADKRESFVLDVTRSQIKISKATFQNRVRAAVVLMRLDIDGPPHRNPDGEEIPCPHLHLYREDFGDKWAMAVPTSKYPSPIDLLAVLDSFMVDCKVVDPPTIDRGLFS